MALKTNFSKTSQCYSYTFPVYLANLLQTEIKKAEKKIDTSFSSTSSSDRFLQVPIAIHLIFLY